MNRIFLTILFLSFNFIKGNAQYFNGEKKFCDHDYWEYNVNIEKDNISFELYPHPENTYHKNKTTPTEIINGKIVFGKIIIPLPENCEDCGEEYQTGRFKYSNGFLYDANIEGGYNIYIECGKNRNIDKYEQVNYLPDPNKVYSIKQNKTYKTKLSLETIRRELVKKYNYRTYDTSVGFRTISEYNDTCVNIYVEEMDDFNLLHYYYDCFK